MAGVAGPSAPMLAGYAAGADAEKTYRVGLFGCGWYGRSDLSRLIQVVPVEVVALSDVDRKTLTGAADMVATRQASRKRTRK